MTQHKIPDDVLERVAKAIAKESNVENLIDARYWATRHREARAAIQALLDSGYVVLADARKALQSTDSTKE